MHETRGGSVLHHDLGWTNPVTEWVSGLSLNNVGFAIVILFALSWIAALAVWRLRAGRDRRLTATS